MESLRALLIDDEFSSLENLQQKLAEFCPDVEIVGIAQKPEEGILLIREHKPDVIFLDIEMPRMNGFRMLNELGNIESNIIFTTAYDHYAIDAIRISAFDYLMKPVAIKDLQNTVERLLKSKQGKTNERLDLLKQSLNSTKSQQEKIAISTMDGLEFIPIKTIIHIESNSNYSKLYYSSGESQLVTRLLKEFEDLLSPYGFFRVHHSHLINLDYIKKYVRGEGGQVILQNGDVIDVARRKKEEFLKLISKSL